MRKLLDSEARGYDSPQGISKISKPKFLLLAVAALVVATIMKDDVKRWVTEKETIEVTSPWQKGIAELEKKRDVEQSIYDRCLSGMRSTPEENWTWDQMSYLNFVHRKLEIINRKLEFIREQKEKGVSYQEAAQQYGTLGDMGVIRQETTKNNDSGDLNIAGDFPLEGKGTEIADYEVSKICFRARAVDYYIDDAEIPSSAEEAIGELMDQGVVTGIDFDISGGPHFPDEDEDEDENDQL